jgi:GntR family transcriptional regulator/MocR family aminotransferase
MSPREAQALDLFVPLDRSRRGVGRQIEGQLREAIRGGALVSGSKLPSTRALAEELAVSRGVVVRAYAQLAAEGYLDLRQGANPAVRAVAPSAPAPSPAAADAAPVKVRHDLRPHLPEVGMFPRTAWLRSLRSALATATDGDLGYVDRRGLPQLRGEVAAYLGRARGVVARPDDILITAGSTHSLSLIARALARSGARAIGFENPSHWLLHTVADRAGLQPVGVPVDRHGLVVDELEDAEVGAVVVSPAHQFPTGRALSPERRAALVRWARASGALIVEDEYDAEFRYDRAPIRALHGLSSEHVAYIGSTSKTVAPGIRLGWAVLPAALAEAVAEELWSTMLHIPGIDQLAFGDFIRRGEFDRHLRRMRKIYRGRRDALVAAVERRLPRLAVRGIAAGLHVLLELPRGSSEESICREARSRGLLIESLSQHALPGYSGPQGLLIGYGAILEPAIAEAVEELARAVASAG